MFNRTTGVAAACVVLLAAACSGSQTKGAPGSTASTPPGTGSVSGQARLQSLKPSGREYEAALAAARREIAREAASVTSASFRVVDGTVHDSKCVSGRLLKIKLIGTFPHVVTSGYPVSPGTSPEPDFTVHAVVMTADAATSHVCVRGVQTGEVVPDPGARILNLHDSGDGSTAGTVASPCSHGFALSLVSDRGGQPNPLAAGYWFLKHGGVGPLPQKGWRVIERSKNAAMLASGGSRLHTLRGPDATWQVDSGNVCP